MHDYDSLERFLKYTMSMTHVYQPLMIRKLLTSGNTATKEEIALEFISQDRSLLEYYKDRTMKWPKKTLEKHNVVSYKRSNMKFTLLLETITDEQRTSLVYLCNKHIAQYMEKYRNRYGIKNPRTPVQGSMKYDVFKKSRGTCCACGVTTADAELVADHIMPVSHGGKTVLDNLQALCRSCNAAKRDRDDLDFLNEHKRLKYRKRDCWFCHAIPTIDGNLAFAAKTESQNMIVAPKSHVSAFSDMIPAEKNDCLDLMETVRSNLQSNDKALEWLDVRLNTRDEHCHISMVPMYAK